MKKILFFIYALSFVAFFSCNNTDSEENNLDQVDTTESPVVEQNIIFPSPLQVASIFKKSGLIYIDNITNNPENISNYDSQMSKSLNFGVYGADLAYCVLNNQNPKAMSYLKSVKSLSSELGITAVFNAENLFESFEKNLGNEDSLIKVLASVQERLDDHLQNTQSEHMGTIYFLGGWIEAIYIGTKVLESSDNVKLTQHLMEQTNMLELILRALKVHPQIHEVELQQVQKHLTELEQIVLNFEYVKGRNFDDIPMDEVQLTGDEIKKLSQKMDELRTYIVSQ